MEGKSHKPPIRRKPAMKEEPVEAILVWEPTDPWPKKGLLPATTARRKTRDRNPRFLLALCGLFALAGLMLLVSVFSRYLTAPAVRQHGTEYEAHAMAKKFVGDRLKCPASAKWPSTLQYKVNAKLTEEQPASGTRWVVHSFVDSQNGFGALIRTHYTVVLETKDGSNWHLVSLDTR